jgi:hypothetical protein
MLLTITRALLSGVDEQMGDQAGALEGCHLEIHPGRFQATPAQHQLIDEFRQLAAYQIGLILSEVAGLGVGAHDAVNGIHELTPTDMGIRFENARGPNRFHNQNLNRAS